MQFAEGSVSLVTQLNSGLLLGSWQSSLPIQTGC